MTKIFTILLFLSPIILFAQKSPTYLSLEGGGNGIVASVNIGKPIIMHHSFRLNFQWGLGISSDVVESNPPINIPAQLTISFGRKNSFLELGVGSSLVLGSKLDKEVDETASSELYLSPVIGFRHETRKWFARFYACPLFHVSGGSVHDDLTSDFINIGVGVGRVF